MALVLSKEGARRLLDWALRATAAPPDLVLVLWSDDLDPDADTVLSDLTACTFGGYQEMTLTRSGWLDPVIDGTGSATTWGADPIEWDVSAPAETVYGYAVYDPTDETLVWSERFDAPRAVAPGDVLGVLPRVSDDTLPV